METAENWRECLVALTPSENWVVLDLGREDPERWSQEVSEQHIGTDSPSESRRAFAEDLLWYWGTAVRQRAMCAALFAPPNGVVLASYTVRELQAPPEALHIDVLRAEAAISEGPFFGKPALTEVDLPLGPALRVHRFEPTAPETDTSAILEGVAHYVLPRDHPTLLECRLLWKTLGLGEELTRIADELANSVRLL
ncbi:MAG: hypothetical protein JF597_50240 [Streptomyces sp.]|uniref:hypothetical protein n=1 Tax=Streptomyces sp. TaxID=1931 RepID=UPI0025DBCA16|nr:hypothetical protein [Streptomyces sp.]MBW8801438.1 hypothetical protein [Streptomyces sp.]